MTSLPPGVSRRSVPMVSPDFVTISDPELIRSVSAHSHIGRPATTELPFMFRVYFYATKFYYPPDKSWAPALLSDGKNEQPQRRQNAIDSIANGFTPDQVNRIEALIKSNDDLPTISRECAKILAQVMLPLPEGEELPDEIAQACCDTLQDFQDMFNIGKYLNARKARAITEEYVRKILPNERYPGDIVHNLGAAAQGMGKAIQNIQGNLSDELIPTLSKDPMIKALIRVPLRTTTLDGMFPEDKPLIPGSSFVILDIGTAVVKSGDDRFLFGVGTDHRQCPFKNLFMTTANEIRDRNMSG